MKIVVIHVYPPIPVRHHDYLAMFESDDGDSPRKGWGATQQEAIDDLLVEWGQCPRCAPVGKAAQWPECKCYFTE